ncbi:MAG: 50S ribosomal protein L6 [Desulfurococcaceae archaeon]
MKTLHIVEKVKIPENVSVQVEDSRVKVRGPKGELVKDFSHARRVYISVQEGYVVVEAYNADRSLKALVGTIAAHIENMITGVTKGFRYKLKVVYSHFPVSVVVDAKNKIVRIRNFLGEKADRVAKIYGNVTVRVEGHDVIVEGIDIEEVGLTAASIERATKIRDLDRRVFADGIYIYERGVAD